jgi:hypothetical protein
MKARPRAFANRPPWHLQAKRIIRTALPAESQANVPSMLPVCDPGRIRNEARNIRAQIQVYLGGNRREGRTKVKLLKLFGLAALAALMAMAFVGAGSAMATGSSALCEDMPDVADGVCTDPAIHVHEATLSGAKAIILTSAINVECDVLFLGDVLGLANPQVIHTGKFTYTNCNNGCTVSQEGTALIKVLRTSHETAGLSYEFQIYVECGILVDCKYNGTGLAGTAKGPLLASHLNGQTVISEQTLNRVGGSFCPVTKKLDITTTPLTHTWIGS